MKILTRVLLILVLLVSISFYVGEKLHENSLESKVIKAQEIYTQLLKYTGVTGYLNPKINIINSGLINAWTDGESVNITVGMLNFIKNNDELALVIGHEIGHVILGHLVVDDGIDQRLKEANSDKYSIYLMLRAGYNVCNADELWKRLVLIEGNDILTSSHPSGKDREDSLDFPGCP